MPQRRSDRPVEVRVVGMPRFRTASGPWRDLPVKNAALLLAFAAVEGHRPRWEAASLVWTGANALENMRQCILRLHRALQGGAKLLVGRESLCLSEAVVVDASGNFADACRRFETGDLLPALQLDMLTEFGSDWLQRARRRWAEARAQAFMGEAGRRAAADDVGGAVQLLQKAFDADPGHRALACELARCQRAIGLPAAADTTLARHRKVTPESAISTPPAAADVEAFGLEATTFVGRERELSSMRQANDEGRAFALVGEPGIGKTSLLQRYGHGTPGLVHVGARDGDVRAPYSTATRWLRRCLSEWGLPDDRQVVGELARILPQLGNPPGGAGVAGVLEQAQIQALRHAHAHGMSALLVDDLHDADSASMAVLRRALVTVEGLRFGFAARTTGATLPEALNDWRSRNGAQVVVVAVPPLSPAEVARLLGQAKAHSAHARASAGNPFRLRELVRARARQADPSASRAPGDEQSRAEPSFRKPSPAAEALAALAAVAGSDFDASLAASALGMAPSTVDDAMVELRQAGTFEGDAFAHDLLREQVRASLHDGTARRWHSTIAAVLAAGPAPSPGRVADHHAAAAEWASAARWAEVAAAHAALVGQRSDQLARLDEAAAWYDRIGRARKAWGVRARAIEPCLYVQGSEAAMARAARVAAEAASPADLATVDAQRARIAVLQQRGSAALRFARSARKTPGVAASAAAFAAVAETYVLASRGNVTRALATITPLMSRVRRFRNAQTRQELWSA
jgi:DNA-binding SARP family transcriptional activator